MKSFLNFLTEAGSTAIQQATRMGLQGDGHGGWYSKEGEFVAKTEKGKLVFYNNLIVLSPKNGNFSIIMDMMIVFHFQG